MTKNDLANIEHIRNIIGTDLDQFLIVDLCDAQICESQDIAFPE